MSHRAAAVSLHFVEVVTWQVLSHVLGVSAFFGTLTLGALTELRRRASA